MSTAKSIPSQQSSYRYDSDDDSDNESDDGVTNVQLGLSDGQVEGDDESNPLISRIGGKAAWLPTQSVPPPDVAHCKYCETPMELLVQIFAPLEQSPYDRTLLAWGCCRPACQRRGQGSLRVIRHLQFNARWAARLEKQRQKQQAREERKKQQAEQAAARKAEQEAKKNVDPFAMSSSTSASTGGPFGAGGFGSTNGSDSNPFGAPTSAASKSTPAVDEAPDSDEDSCTSSDEEDSINDEEERLSDELAMKAAVSSSSSSTRDAWTTTAQPSYRPSLYLSTIPESSASARAGDKAAKAQQSSSADNEEDDDDDDDDDATNGMKSFEKEGYEKMMLAGMDDVLEKFIARVGAEGRQVVRYEMGGQPLPFSAQGELYKSLWPMSGSGSSKSTKPTFDSTRIPPCQVCGSKRTFEFQLMPNLVNTLRADSIQGGADDHNNDTTTNTTVDDATTRKRRELEAVLGKSLPSLPGSDGITRTNAQDAQRLKQKTGLCWSTALVFVCEKDCCVPREKNGPEGETWREEWVGLQFEE